jgi:hypothetical protein
VAFPGIFRLRAAAMIGRDNQRRRITVGRVRLDPGPDIIDERIGLSSGVQILISGPGSSRTRPTVMRRR